MNLLDPETRWLPVLDQRGRRRLAAMSEVVDDEIVAFASGRADGDLALKQVAIAVLQTLLPSTDAVHWRERLHHPPGRDELQARLDPHRAAFEFDADGARWMQDFELRDGDAEPSPIGSLFIEAPGGNTLEKNADLFVKRGGVERLCPSCAAIALATLQINGPAGGAGFRTGVRGGGPLTTLLVADDAPGVRRRLWDQLWLNTLPEPAFRAIGGEVEPDDPQRTFPWLGPIGRLQRDGGLIAPSQCHPAMVLWAMPRRIRLSFDHVEAGRCGLCGVEHPALLTRYVERNQGLNYKGPWRHPLSPYYAGKDGEWLPVHPNPGGLGWRHWAGFVFGASRTNGGAMRPAEVVRHFVEGRRDRRRPIAWPDGRRADLRLEVAGYDMDSAKARCWYAATMPLHHLDEWSDEERDLLRGEVGQWTEAARLAADATRAAVKDAWFGHDARGDLAFITESVWSRTEPAFHDMLARRVADFDAGDERRPIDVAADWLRRLRRVAYAVFDEHAARGAIEATNPAGGGPPHDGLRKALRGRAIREALGLPATSSAAAASAMPTKPVGRHAAAAMEEMPDA